MRICRMILAATLAGLFILPVSAAAQAVLPERARLLVTVTDQTGAVLPGATVSVTQEEAAAAPRLAPVQTSLAGVAAVENLVPGRYAVQAAFPGFETVSLPGIRLRAGETRRTMVLPIKKLSEDVSVARDRQSAAIDPRGNAFSTVLTREQIAALPDDPDELEAALKAMAPPGSTMRIDGFTGGRLPPKSQIRSIRLPRMDMFAAQNHGGMTGMMFIDIMTGPSTGPLRGSIDAAFRDDALNAQNPFTPAKGDEGMTQGGVSLSGAVVPGKSSFSASIQQAQVFDSGNVLAAVPGATVALAIRRPTDRQSINVRFDQALNAAHMLRLSFQRTAVDLENQGVGSFDLIERAFSTRTSDNIFRMSENGAVGRRGFWESRLQVRWSQSASVSAIEAPTIRVVDAFTSGGAQRRGGARAVDVEAASDYDYVRGAHSFRAGVLFEGGRYRSDDFSNYLGTYTFASLADYEAGRPSNYAQRIGDPAVQYSNLQIGIYAQDDFRLHKSLMLSYGLRYEAQTLISDQQNFSPRVSLTWSPLKSGRTTLRGGAGYFSDWLGLGTYEQTLRVDGFRQRELNVRNPSWPEPGTAEMALPTNRYQLADGLTLPASAGLNVGIDQSITPAFRVTGTYTFRRGVAQLRGRNLNAPIDGIRPDAGFGNVIAVTGDAASRSHTLGVSASVMLLQRRQTMFAANYSFSSNESNTTGPFAIPASSDDLTTEWGLQAPRHRAGGLLNTSPMRNLTVGVNFRLQSGLPYNVTTGTDANGDGVFNDRPAGVRRNAELGAMQWDIGLRVGYTIGFGPRAQTGGTGGTGGGPMIVTLGGPGGGMPGALGGGASDRRFRVELYASAQNVTDHDNFIGYSGVIASPFYRLPTNVMNPRKIELGVRFAF